MRRPETEPDLRALGRLIGLFYLALIAFGAAGYLPSTALVDANDPLATAAAIRSHEQLWRLSILAMWAMLVCDLVIASLIAVALRPYAPALALAAFGARLAMIGLQGQALVARMAPLWLLGRPDGASVSLDALAIFDAAFGFGLAFFGLHCTLAGAGMWRARLAPRPLSALLVLVGLLYLADWCADLVFPNLRLPGDLLTPAYLIEFSVALWLTLFGFRAPNSRGGAASATSSDS